MASKITSSKIIIPRQVLDDGGTMVDISEASSLATLMKGIPVEVISTELKEDGLYAIIEVPEHIQEQHINPLSLSVNIDIQENNTNA